MIMQSFKDEIKTSFAKEASRATKPSVANPQKL